MILKDGNQFVSALQLQRANTLEQDKLKVSSTTHVIRRKLISEYWNIRHAIEEYIDRMDPKTGERNDKTV